ncbi:hypothetical protein KSS87_011151, partial [Heliosperma pusillum]
GEVGSTEGVADGGSREGAACDGWWLRRGRARGGGKGMVVVAVVETLAGGGGVKKKLEVKTIKQSEGGYRTTEDDLKCVDCTELIEKSKLKDDEQIYDARRFSKKRKHDDISRCDDPMMDVLEGVDYCELSYDGKRISSYDGRRKLNKITWEGGAPFYSYMTYEEFAATEKEIEELLSHPPGWDDPNTYKKQSKEFCEECFPLIQKKWPEMSDYELVESMDASFFVTWSCFAHLNFKAKQKGAPDSSTSTYFVEFDITNREILCFCEILIDSSSGYSCCCLHCSGLCPDAIAGFVYHPKDTSSFRGGY